jgi:hypothetical protein
MLSMPRSHAAHRVVEHLLLEVEDVEPSVGSEPFGHGERVVARARADFEHALAALRGYHVW